MKVKILIADDEPKYRDVVLDFLKNEGYEVIAAKDGEEAIDLFFSTANINLVILDVMMPKLDGWKACREIRKQSDVPILMLTALGDKNNEIRGFELGVDEYISKPFIYEVFIARVKVLLKEVIKEHNEIIKIEDVLIDQARKSVSINKNRIDLTHKEYKLLLYLAKNITKVLSREQILDTVWGYNYFGDTRTVDTHIKNLRAKLAEYDKLIKTVRGLGYRMEIEND